ncbi:hypothetical protein M422DRAFT_104693, partial [Sphaerobolus stellatus SS14]
LFEEHVYVVLGGGDMPAVSKAFLHMKGHNGISPCRLCSILSVCAHRVPGQKGPSTYYCPLHRPSGFPPPDEYDPLDLPFRTDSQFRCQAQKIASAPTNVEAERLARLYGIKSLPLLGHIDSLFLPRSFPYDFMHLMENLMENMVSRWTGSFKAFGAGAGEYEITKPVWERIGETTLNLNKTIPSAFGRRLMNIAEDRSYFTAEAWLVWTTLLAPELLQGRLETRFYNHTLQLVDLIRRTMSFDYTYEELRELRNGWAEWVQNYERCVI